VCVHRSCWGAYSPLSRLAISRVMSYWPTTVATGPTWIETTTIRHRRPRAAADDGKDPSPDGTEKCHRFLRPPEMLRFPFTCLSVCLSVCPSVCLSVYQQDNSKSFRRHSWNVWWWLTTTDPSLVVNRFTMGIREFLNGIFAVAERENLYVFCR